MRLHTWAVRTQVKSLHWKLTLGENPLSHQGLEPASILRLAFSRTIYQLSHFHHFWKVARRLPSVNIVNTLELSWWVDHWQLQCIHNVPEPWHWIENCFGGWYDQDFRLYDRDFHGKTCCLGGKVKRESVKQLSARRQWLESAKAKFGIADASRHVQQVKQLWTAAGTKLNKWKPNKTSRIQQ